MNTSIALGVLPSSDQDHDTLLSTRATFDTLAPASKYTPHITLAYYRPDPPCELDVRTLRETLLQLTSSVTESDLLVDLSALTVAHFSDMATYWNVTPTDEARRRR